MREDTMGDREKKFMWTFLMDTEIQLSESTNATALWMLINL
jgi:hypothetical protein